MANPTDSTSTSNTPHGTLISPEWPPDWTNLVLLRESALDRSICGAQTPSGDPCERDSSHPCGRCTHHGGAPSTGAAPGNTNAQTHGIFSSSLRRCTGPCGYCNPEQFPGHAASPTCEHDIFDRHVQGYALDLALHTDHDPETAFERHVVLNALESFALSYIMVDRASVLVAKRDLIQAPPEGSKTMPRVSPELQAWLRLNRERRACLKALIEAVRDLERRRNQIQVRAIDTEYGQRDQAIAAIRKHSEEQRRQLAGHVAQNGGHTPQTLESDHLLATRAGLLQATNRALRRAKKHNARKSGRRHR